MVVPEQVLNTIRRMSVSDLVDLVRAIAAEREVRDGNDAIAVDETVWIESSEPSISLRDFGSNRLAMIRAARDMTDLGLREARELVDGHSGGMRRPGGGRDDGPEPAGVTAVPKPPLPAGNAAAEARLAEGCDQYS